MALPTGILFTGPRNKPLDAAGRFQPNATRKFFLTDGVTLAPVYRDARFQYPHSQSPTPITADGDGRFPLIYMDPTITYRAQLFSVGGVLLEDANPYINNPFSYQIAQKPTGTSIVSQTTLLIDPDLRLNLPAAGVYLIEAMTLWTTTNPTPANEDFTVVLNCTNQDATAVNAFAYSGVCNAISLGGSGVLGTPLGAFGLTGSNAVDVMLLRGVASITAPGQLSVQWAQITPRTFPLTLMISSTLIAQRIG